MQKRRESERKIEREKGKAQNRTKIAVNAVKQAQKQK